MLTRPEQGIYYRELNIQPAAELLKYQSMQALEESVDRALLTVGRL